MSKKLVVENMERNWYLKGFVEKRDSNTGQAHIIRDEWDSECRQRHFPVSDILIKRFYNSVIVIIDIINYKLNIPKK